ncbi:glycoside hydrolase domain-containing protein [Streptomyces sp. NPDC051940]|uniref:glycoside hydrolase domain-containing protein n=1 Tax=Streptomyces sp. NPDC051940 TaxID=3155675 RepID=UPI0034280CC0
MNLSMISHARRRRATGVPTTLAALTAAVLTALSAPAQAASAQAAGADAAPGGPALSRDVSFHGYQLRVPAGWPVVDLAEHPDTCVRFDRHTVYLGHPTDAGQATCPAGLVGRTEALLVEPLDARGRAAVDASTRIAPAGSATAPATAPRGERAGLVRQAVPAAGVLVTATAGSDAATVQSVLDSARLGADAKSVRLEAASGDGSGTAAVTESVSVQPGTYTGLGFDPCAAPSTSQMSAWAASPFRAIGVYISGISAACAQPNLTSSWVGTQVANGWHILPIHVGLQAPCTGFGHRVSYTLSTAASQGRTEAQEAVAAAGGLGLPAGSVLYNDMEGYDQTNAACSDAVMTFLSAWTDELHANGYLSGVYSSAASGMADLAAEYTRGVYTNPDHIWFARWNGANDTDAKPYVPDAYWADHQRVHQLSGDTDETWGGVTINIDRDYLDVDPGPYTTPGVCGATLDFALYTAISSGSSGSLVSAAQCLLLRQGHYTGAVDGSYGAATAAAVQSFQSAKALPVTGAVDAHTWTALLAAGTTPTLQQGSSGEDVKRLQRALIAARGQTLTIDGDFGPATLTAVKAYQSAQGLGSDGVVGPLTWAALQAGK